MSGFAALPLNGRRMPRPFRCEKLIQGEWVRMSEFAEPIDEKQVQRHVRAIGGHMRLMRGEAQVREWRNGCEVGP